ncbi:MAG TPA: hypothetical protein VGB30_12440 [bacterium]|jgi:hypothetical protein
MRINIPRLTVLLGVSFLLIFGFSGLALAGEKADNSGDNVKMEEMEDDGGSDDEMMDESGGEMDIDESDDSMMEDEEVMEEEEMVEIDYLDDADDLDGYVTFLLKLSEEDEDNPFWQRYHDPFEGDSFYLDELYAREGSRGGPFIRFGADNSWDGSYNVWGEIRNPRNTWLYATDRAYGNYNLPDGDLADRHDFTAGFQYYTSDENLLSGNYYYRENSITDMLTGATFKSWENNSFDVSYDFELGNYDILTGLAVTSYDDRTGNIYDTDSTTGILQVGRGFSNNSYIGTSISYNNTNVYDDIEMESFTYGAYVRLVEPLSIDNLNVISHVSWLDTDEGPSILHPKGDEFSFDVEGRLHPADNLWFTMGWDSRYQVVTWADQFTNQAYKLNPLAAPGFGEVFYEDTVWTDKFSLSGRWKISDDFDFMTEHYWIDKDAIPWTNWVAQGSPTLWFETQTKHTYSIRYHGPRDSRAGDWLLKYESDSRENDARGNNSDLSHFSLNWSGMLADNIFLYLGGGYLESSNDVSTETDTSQKGSEFGGGLSWMLNDSLTFYGDYWNYDVGGTFGYEETSFNLGLGYDYSEDWNWLIEFESVDGEFGDLALYDYQFENLALKITRKW